MNRLLTAGKKSSCFPPFQVDLVGKRKEMQEGFSQIAKERFPMVVIKDRIKLVSTAGKMDFLIHPRKRHNFPKTLTDQDVCY